MRRHFRGGEVKLRYLTQSGRWPSGNPRFYVRIEGKRKPMPDAEPSSPAFLSAYAVATGHAAAPQAISGTIGAGITAFLASDRYLGVSRATRALWRRAMDDIRTRYGSGRLGDLEARHIRADIARLKPNPAVIRLKAWRAACQWWEEMGLAPRDASYGIKRPKVARTAGHIPWSRDDLAAFRGRWPSGSPERLAFELFFWTGARVCDACRMSEPMISEGWLSFTQEKTGGDVQIPIQAPAPEWAEPDGLLLAELAARPRHIILMVTAYGRQRTVKGTSQWFAAAARQAGLIDRTAHGLRKSRAILMSENGATTHQIAAWTGHQSLKEVEEYTRKADRKRIISGTKPATPSDNFSRSDNSQKKGA
jgi:integrase